jgi:hypothetical protein
MPVYFTYILGIDGLGAQYQRIVGLIALAKKYDCIYVHTDLKQMEHLHSKEYLQDVENYFQLRNNYANFSNYKYDMVIELYSCISVEIINYYKEQSQQEGKDILLKMNHVYCMIDESYKWHNNNKPTPELYEEIMPTLRSIKREIPLLFFTEEKQNIAIHIRRGDVGRNTNTYIGLDKYQEIIYKLNCIYGNQRFLIFTEINNENRWEFNLFLKANSNLDIKIMADLDVLTTFEHLCKADILVMSKSSFSYLAGLYNTGTVYYTDFHHSKLARWKILD